MDLLLSTLIGNVPKLTVTSTDPETGAAVDGTLTATVTAPDDTSVSPTVTAVSTGEWTVEWLPEQTGSYRVRIVLSGDHSGAVEGRVLVKPSGVA